MFSFHCASTLAGVEFKHAQTFLWLSRTVIKGWSCIMSFSMLYQVTRIRLSMPAGNFLKSWLCLFHGGRWRKTSKHLVSVWIKRAVISCQRNCREGHAELLTGPYYIQVWQNSAQSKTHTWANHWVVVASVQGNLEAQLNPLCLSHFERCQEKHWPQSITNTIAPITSDPHPESETPQILGCVLRHCHFLLLCPLTQQIGHLG